MGCLGKGGGGGEGTLKGPSEGGETSRSREEMVEREGRRFLGLEQRE